MQGDARHVCGRRFTLLRDQQHDELCAERERELLADSLPDVFSADWEPAMEAATRAAAAAAQAERAQWVADDEAARK